jgi:hypothetical protein
MPHPAESAEGSHNMERAACTFVTLGRLGGPINRDANRDAAAGRIAAACW